MIDEKFIRNWITFEQDDDEKEYKDVIGIIKEQDKNIDWDIFERIYNWKASRSKNYLEKENKDLYISAFKEIYNLNDEEKINFYKETKQRKKLPGILEPIASTILHFMYPDKFPIRDVRTVGTLIDKELLHTKISYNDYRTEIFKIYDNCKGKFTLRQIDKALFTYNEEKEKLLRVLEGKKSFSDVGIRLKNPRERKMELINDLDRNFRKKLEKLNELKKELES